MESLGDDFSAFLIVYCHCVNLIDEGIMLSPNLFWLRYMLLKVPDTRTSSHLHIYWFTMLSMF